MATIMPFYAEKCRHLVSKHEMRHQSRSVPTCSSWSMLHSYLGLIVVL